MPTWVIIGASRGIGLEFVRQLLARGDQVIAAIRDQYMASQLWQVAAGVVARPGACQLFECDVTSETSITAFASRIAAMSGLRIDYLVLNAGVLKYPNRATEVSFEDFDFILRTNTVGPIITAQKLLSTGVPIGTIAFMSSDSGSAAQFRDFEDGFGAYAASKAALNQMLRHMHAELRRNESQTIVLAIHPGEVATDMHSVNVEWEVSGIISPEESVSALLQVIPSKTVEHSGTFWTWENNASSAPKMLTNIADR